MKLSLFFKLLKLFEHFSERGFWGLTVPALVMTRTSARGLESLRSIVSSSLPSAAFSTTTTTILFVNVPFFSQAEKHYLNNNNMPNFCMTHQFFVSLLWICWRAAFSSFFVVFSVSDYLANLFVTNRSIDRAQMWS